MTNLLSQSTALSFITAGKAIFTCKSLKTGNRFTYKVEAPKGKDAKDTAIFFVKVLTGSDNNTDYSFFGCVRRQNGSVFFTPSAKSRISSEAPSVAAFRYVLQNLAANREMPSVEIWHEGSCCRCGRRLTTPESVQAGIGPECAGRR